MPIGLFDPAQTKTMVREVTDEEVEFYREHGWVMLKGLLAPELVQELRRVGERFSGEETSDFSGATRLALNPEAEPYPSLFFSEVMYRNAERLMDRRSLNDDGVRICYGGEAFHIKPAGAGTRAIYHQDAVEHGSDRIGETRFWIAAADITADMGPMSFVDRSHRDGPLGSVLWAWSVPSDPDPKDLVDLFPKLAERLTPPLEYKAGDATVHHGYTIHCGEVPNTTDRPRLSILADYIPADMRYINGTRHGNPGSDRTQLTEEEYPVIDRPSP